MKERTQHTSGPWVAETYTLFNSEEGETGWCIKAGDDTVADCVGCQDDPLAEANAAFIVRACNEYDALKAQNAELVEALRMASTYVDGEGTAEEIEQVNAALAKAQP